ncbi:hypothetical protein [Longispora fulva]|uniref:Uncharacterized protein n=1 Tax=Longispora fulva TaxID=619741 RepID=A0A8J7H0E2_9ACTN|nr:hypothetical protein [Longispora fulva]MBG6141680.1 hypothetical protein [Longispora fulva]
MQTPYVPPRTVARESGRVQIKPVIRVRARPGAGSQPERATGT